LGSTPDPAEEGGLTALPRLGWGPYSTPQTRLRGGLQHSPDSLSVFKGAYFYRETETGKDGRRGRRRVAPLQLGTLNPAVEEEREGRRARNGAWVGASGYFFKHWSYELWLLISR